MLKVGECVHLDCRISFICSDRIHQNYPCPHKGNFSRCPCYIAFTKEMEEQLKAKGYFCIPVKEV